MKKLLVLSLLLITFVLSACGRIETGNVGVRTDFNKTVESTELQPGWYGAFFSQVTEFTVKETELKLDNLRVKAADNLYVPDLDLSIFYTVAPGSVAELFVKYQGMSVAFEGNTSLFYPGYNLVNRVARGVVYDAISKFPSLTLHTMRNEIENMINTKLQAELDSTDKGVFLITKVVIRQVATDPTLEASIQQAVQMQKRVEAKQAELALAEAEAARQLAEAQGTAAANKILSDSLNPAFLRYTEILAMRKFAGDGTHTIVLPYGTPAPSLIVGKQ